MEWLQTLQEYRFVVMIQIGHRTLKTINKPEIKGKLCATETPRRYQNTTFQLLKNDIWLEEYDS